MSADIEEVGRRVEAAPNIEVRLAATSEEDVPCPAFCYEWSELPSEPARSKDRPRLRVLTLNLLADVLAKGSEDTSIARETPCPKLFEEVGVGGVAFCAQAAAGQEAFKFRCSRDALAWSRRWPMLRSMILELDPDLIGLQEVDLGTGVDGKAQAHDKQIRSDLGKVGYDGTFACKMGRACDGVGLFWRRGRLKQAGSKEIWRLGSSVHVALAQPLCLDGNWRFTAVATHLKAGLSQAAENARIEQAQVLLRKLARHPQAVLLADLNAHCRHVAAGVGDEAAPPGEPPLMGSPQVYSMLISTGPMRSACRVVLGDEPQFTCWGGWVDREVRLVCDYILVKGDLLEPRRALRCPSQTEVLRFAERLPNAQHPTDHFPVAADLVILAAEEKAIAEKPPAPAPPMMPQVASSRPAAKSPAPAASKRRRLVDL